MPKNYTTQPHWHGNMLAAIDFETTGGDENKHEIIQIAIVPLGLDYEPLSTIQPFYTSIAPMHPELADPGATAVHGINLDDLMVYAPSHDQVEDMLIRWVADLELAYERRIIPLAHNWSFECRFMQKWLGFDLFQKMFQVSARDPMVVATAINDMAFLRGRRAPFERVSNGWLCEHFGIVNEHAHDALYDCYATAKVYKKLLETDLIL